jgi:peroxiredoxin
MVIFAHNSKKKIMKQIFVMLAVGLMLFSCSNTGKIGEGSAQSKEMTTQLDSISYAIGLDLGKNLKTTGLDLNPEILKEGINSVWNETEPALSDADNRRMLNELQAEIRKNQMEELAKQSQQGNPNQPQMNSKFDTGEAVPEISLPNPDGQVINLSDLQGKYVMIDFWASWCKPCRIENPNVVRVYNKYKDQGFEILGVSLDRDRNSWLQAIEKDGLTWKHVSDLKFWQSEAAQSYGINAIPYTVLLDKEGKVIAENLRGASLEAKLGEIFGN